MKADYQVIKVRENKNGKSFFFKIWNPQRETSQTITLGKESEDFTFEDALKKMRQIKELFKRGKYNYKEELEKIKKPYKEFEKSQQTEENTNSTVVLTKAFENYYNFKYNELKNKFFLTFRDALNIQYSEIEENQVFIKKKGSFTRRKRSYSKYILYINNSYAEYATKDVTEINRKILLDLKERLLEKDLADKSIFNILSEFRAIINWTIDEYKLTNYVNPFSSLKNFVVNPKNKRERVLDEEQLKELFTELYKLNNKNSFIAAIMGYCFGARKETVLNIQKKHFNLNTGNINNLYFNEVELFNFKSNRTYKLPIPETLGKFLFQYLLDFKLDEYVLRPKIQKSTIPKALNYIPKSYYETADRVCFYNNEQLGLWGKIESLKKTNQHLRLKLLIDSTQEVNKNNRYIKDELKSNHIKKDKLITELNEKVKELKSNNKYKNEHQFDFHSLRHQLATTLSTINPFYASICLNHETSSINKMTELYSKIDKKYFIEILDKVYSRSLKEVIEDSFEFNAYARHNKSHIHVYNKQYLKLRVSPHTEYISTEEEVLRGLKNISIYADKEEMEKVIEKSYYEAARNNSYLDEIDDYIEKIYNIEKKERKERKFNNNYMTGKLKNEYELHLKQNTPSFQYQFPEDNNNSPELDDWEFR